MPIDPESLLADPLRQLELWLGEAEAAGSEAANAFALATASPDGAPSVRVVLLRGLGSEGLTFFTDRRSRKGRDLAGNPRAAAVFHWPALSRQVRVAGTVAELDAERSAGYFATRPRGSQLSAWASVQGAEIESRALLETRAAEAAARHPGEVPLPPFWGGYLLHPERLEFWEGRSDRLHDRVEYLRAGAGWIRRRLQP